MICPVCFSEVRPNRIEVHDGYELHYCSACDVQFSQPMKEPGRAYYEEHEFYRDDLQATSDRLLNWQHRRFLKDRPCPGGTLLDVGCGTGYFLAAARKVGYQVTGIDLNRDAIAVGRKRFHLEDLHAMTLAEFIINHPGRTFDVITAFDLLEHLGDPPRFLEEAKRTLKPGGYLALSVPNWKVWAMFRDPLDKPPNHLTRWSVASLGSFLAVRGFHVVKMAEERSAFSFLLRNLRFGIVKRMLRQAPQHMPTGKRLDDLRKVAERLAITKVWILRTLDLPFSALFHLIRSPGFVLYCLARK